MRDPLDIPDVVRMSVPLRLRVPVGFRERVVSVATAEGVSFAEFTRRAIVERVRRLEGTEPPGSQQRPATAGSSPPTPDTLSARAEGSPTPGASASASTSTRRDA